MNWRFLETSGNMSATGSKAATGARNMAIDETVLAEVEAGRSPPTVRIYGWSPACISLGHFQKPDNELDLARVRELGFDVVVRPTGGRAVLHINELTYSLIARQDAEPWCATQASSYRVISQAVAQALASEGFGLTLDRGYPVEKPQEMRAMTPCFSSTARSEVVWGDRKVVGSAQRRMRGAFLQHGSILVSRDHRLMVECLKLDMGKRARYLEILDQNAVSLEEVLGRPVAWEALAQGFGERLAAGLNVAYRAGELTGREKGLAEELEGEKRRAQAELLGRIDKASQPVDGHPDRVLHHTEDSHA